MFGQCHSDGGNGQDSGVRRVQYPNRLSINYGRPGNDPAYGTMSAEEIPGRVPGYDFEMLNDLMDLLRRQSTPEMPLADLFMSILRGEGTRVQRSRFGYSAADAGRESSSRRSRSTPNRRITGRYCTCSTAFRILIPFQFASSRPHHDRRSRNGRTMSGIIGPSSMSLKKTTDASRWRCWEKSDVAGWNANPETQVAHTRTGSPTCWPGWLLTAWW